MIMLDGFACGHTAADAGGQDLGGSIGAAVGVSDSVWTAAWPAPTWTTCAPCRNIALQVRANQVRSERKVAECELALCVGCGEERRGPDR